MEELLKSLGLETETITKIVDGMKENKMFVSKEENIDIRYKKLKKEFEELKTSNEELIKTGDVNKELQKQLEEANNKYTNHIIDTKLEKALGDNKCKYNDVVKKLADKSKLTIENDDIKGLDELVTSLKDTYKDFFEEDKPQAPVKTGITPINGSGNKVGLTYEQVINSNDPKLVADYFNNNKY